MKFPAFGTSITKLPQPVRKADVPVKATLTQRTPITLLKLINSLKILGQSSIDILIRQQYKNAVDKNEYPELDWLDLEKAKKAKKRKADLERIERFKTSGM